MAAVPSKPVSLLASLSASVQIPNTHGKSSSGDHRAMLPTPPNSISPTFPPQRKPHASSLQHVVDSDVELLDADHHHPPAPLSSAALSGLEAEATITPAMLARNHLPDMLLANGPVAIKHLLMNLAQTVPGFSRIPQAKARRLVVAALESRTAASIPNGETAFEKVGWGRWDAYIVGQPRTDRVAGAASAPNGIPVAGSHALAAFSPPASVPESYAVSSGGGLQIPRAAQAARRFPSQRREDLYSGSWAASSALSGRGPSDYDVDMHMAEHEADKMSLDGGDDDDDDGYDSPPAPEALDEDLELDDEDDATDEEDWAGMGAEMLRQGSYRGYGGGLGSAGVVRDYNQLSKSMARTKTSPSRSLRPASRGVSMSYQPPAPKGWSNMAGLPESVQEREAAEALLKMGSM
ncbi:putative Sin3 binding protein-domain-containing protein [Phyllosticta citrichinensis]|uniref:Sin3 binding protein-domain-containing protein n=1 Tax=Phyllosticta citrichinensis TaxID=1130410 RepID=A0ABR1XGK7_9PEZI